jgi:3-isopropylmalate dehydrogenase
VLHYAAQRPQADADGSDAQAGAAEQASRAIYEAVLECSAAGIRTPDLGGHAATSDVATEVAGRVRTKLEAWSALGTR